MPTRVGNELRAMETYGFNRFGLDMQTFWYELYSDAQASLRDDIDSNELHADTYVCSIYVIGFVAVTYRRRPQYGDGLMVNLASNSG